MRSRLKVFAATALLAAALTPLAPVPSHVNRGDLYAKVLSARTHDMHWEWASTFVTVSPDAHGRA